MSAYKKLARCTDLAVSFEFIPATEEECAVLVKVALTALQIVHIEPVLGHGLTSGLRDYLF